MAEEDPRVDPDEWLEARRVERVYAEMGRRMARIPRGAVVSHIDGDPRNHELENLRIVDPQENTTGGQ